MVICQTTKYKIIQWWINKDISPDTCVHMHGGSIVDGGGMMIILYMCGYLEEWNT
jgi:hypothetical protein